MENDLDMALCEMTKQRDVLLEALEEISTFPRYRMPADIAKEAIAKVKELQEVIAITPVSRSFTAQARKVEAEFILEELIKHK